VLAGHTILPVIGIPMPGWALDGLDSLLSTVQMPKGVPVATVAIGKPGAINAAILAVQMLALSDTGLKRKLVAYKAKMRKEVLKSNDDLQKQIGK
jgi:phosphoribosylaminoimidazole carboxylase PurE protein